MREGIKQEPEDNFYERVMVDMEEAGQTQMFDSLTYKNITKHASLLAYS